MIIQWKKLTFQLLAWVTIEMLLGFLGLDELADYSEFLQGRHLVVLLP